MRNLPNLENNEKLHEKSYEKLHRPSSEFKTRNEYLENELKIINTKRFKLNLPKRDFNFEIEDFAVVLAGTIGIITMIAAIVTIFAQGFGLPPEFVMENVRFELIIAGIFAIVMAGFLHSSLSPP